MYICNCEGVTERQIRSAARLGACSMRDLREGLCVAQNCGKCASDVKAILRDEQAQARSHGHRVFHVRLAHTATA